MMNSYIMPSSHSLGYLSKVIIRTAVSISYPLSLDISIIALLQLALYVAPYRSRNLSLLTCYDLLETVALLYKR